MRKRIVIVGICALCLVGIGTAPRYLEELRIGGGYGDSADGGADFDKAGNIATDGSVKATAGFEAGKDSTSRGELTAWDGAGSNAPGVLKLGSTNGTVGYVFMSNDRSGLRIHSSLPTSDADGDWVKAKTVTDLSSPPAIGGTTPNSGKFTSLEATGTATIHGNLSVGPDPSTTYVFELGSGTANPSVMNVDHWASFSGSTAGRGLVGLNAYIKSNGSPAQHYTHGSLGYSGLWFSGGEMVFYGATGATTADAAVATLATLNSSTGLTLSGDMVASGGDVIAGTANQTRGVVTAYQGSGGNTAAVLKLASGAGFLYYFFVEDDGTLKVHNTLPTSDSDGGEVGEQFSSEIGTFTANDTTPSVLGRRLFRVPATWTAGNNITMFDNADGGQQIVVIGGDSDCVIVDASHLKLAGNWTAATGKTLSLVFDGTDWFETSRSDN